MDGMDVMKVQARHKAFLSFFSHCVGAQPMRLGWKMGETYVGHQVGRRVCTYAAPRQGLSALDQVLSAGGRGCRLGHCPAKRDNESTSTEPETS